jgi:CRP-like cAMP-binding protein
VLSSRAEPATDIWFPHRAVVTLTVTDGEGRSAQTGVVGPEGCVGAETLFGQRPALADAAVQIEGPISVISTRQLRPALLTRPAIGVALAACLQDLALQATQICACNRLHTLESRCCGWLLLLRARAGKDDLGLTQENLAALLGGGRSRINVILGALERAGLVRRRRGRIQVRSPDGLMARACECHRIIDKVFETTGSVPPGTDTGGQLT